MRWRGYWLSQYALRSAAIVIRYAALAVFHELNELAKQTGFGYAEAALHAQSPASLTESLPCKSLPFHFHAHYS